MIKYLVPAAIVLSTIPASVYFMSLICAAVGRPMTLF